MRRSIAGRTDCARRGLFSKWLRVSENPGLDHFTSPPTWHNSHGPGHGNFCRYRSRSWQLLCGSTGRTTRLAAASTCAHVRLSQERISQSFAHAHAHKHTAPCHMAVLCIQIWLDVNYSSHVLHTNRLPCLNQAPRLPDPRSTVYHVQ